MKFNDEELSRILSAHEAGDLRAGGSDWEISFANTPWTPTSCAIQAGKLIRISSLAYQRDEEFANAFDFNYKPTWSTARLLRWLESQGAA